MLTPESSTPPPAAPEAPPIAYAPEQREVIDGLVQCQKKLGVTDEHFAKRHLQGYSGSTWSRLRDGKYRVKNLDRVFAELRIALRSVRQRIAVQARSVDVGTFHESDHFKAVFTAIEEAMSATNENRLVVNIAPTGGGKSRLCNEVAKVQTTTIVRASRAWHSSYYFAALDVARSLGAVGHFGSAGEARIGMLDQLRELKRVLAIDEGNYFGPKSIDMLKDILNETDSAVLLCLTRTHWLNMKRYWSSFDQVQRRIHKVFELEKIAPSEVLPFLADAGLNGDAKEASVVLAEAANLFGHFDTIQRVIKRLQERAGEHPTTDDVRAAIEFVQSSQDRKVGAK